MKRFTFLLTALFALVFGQTAYAQIGVMTSTDDVQYEYYIKNQVPIYTLLPSSGDTKLLSGGSNATTKAKFIFKASSSVNGYYELYVTNQTEGTLLPLVVGEQQESGKYYLTIPESGTATPFSFSVQKNTNSGNGTGRYNKYALKLQTQGNSSSSWDVSGSYVVACPSTNSRQYVLWYVEAAAPAPMVFSSTNVGALATYSSALDAAIPDGVKAYMPTLSSDNSEVTLTEISSADNYIPAGVGVIIEQTGTSQYYPTSSPSGKTAPSGTSVLTATSLAQSAAPTYDTSTATTSATGSIVVTKADGTNYYGLGSYTSDGTSVQAFLPFSETSTITMPAYKAYLTTTSTRNAIKMVFPDGSTTSINGVNVGEKISKGAIYDLSGRRVAEPAKGSLYIQNGKKFIAE